MLDAIVNVLLADPFAPAAKVRFPPLVLFAATRRIPQLLETASEVAAF